ncbi:peptidoglycan editing factor PgeF [candidate division KSB1 bacterium]|nr:peptidoglycan editing factor PgeF [candidate division KSB1 bacterium]
MFFKRIDSTFNGKFSELFKSHYVSHGFSTRQGGFSSAPFDTLNLGSGTEDKTMSVSQNRKRFFQAVEITESQCVFPIQVHGDCVRTVTIPGTYPDTDAVITNQSGLVLTIQIADCVPVYLIDPVQMAVGLVHAGWRGSCAGIVEKTICQMNQDFGSVPSDIQVFIGPSIGPCCYEVGEDVASQFENQYLSGTWLDLWQYTEDQAQQAGVHRKKIYRANLCTRCHSSWFFSHRGSQGKTGRMMAFLGVRANENPVSTDQIK